MRILVRMVSLLFNFYLSCKLIPVENRENLCDNVCHTVNTLPPPPNYEEVAHRFNHFRSNL